MRKLPPASAVFGTGHEGKEAAARAAAELGIQKNRACKIFLK